jgi:hypothetical protein
MVLKARQTRLNTVICVREILDDPDPSSIPQISENTMTVKEMSQEARHEEALNKYLLDSPQLAEEIKDLPADDQKDQIQWAFEDEAEAQGLQPGTDAQVHIKPRRVRGRAPGSAQGGG